VFEVFDVAPGFRSLGGDSSDTLPPPAGVVSLQEVERHAPHRSGVGSRVRLVNRAAVLAHLHVECPLESVLDLPVLASALRQSLYRRRQTRQEDVQFARCHVPHPPATPGARLLASQAMPEATKARLREMAAKLDYTAMTEPSAFRRMTWHLGSEQQELSARFAFLRVCVTREGAESSEGTLQEWLVIEWRGGEPKPQRFYLCDLPGDTPRTVVVRTIKERWRFEAIHSELKNEVGFDHFEGRSWPGWNHHVTLALCCHALLIAERCVAFPPSHPADQPLVRTADRPARHQLHSVPTMRLRLGRRTTERFLPRCPGCLQAFPPEDGRAAVGGQTPLRLASVGWPREIALPGLPQIRTCATHASGSSNQGFAT
jgi:hypothetical protein